MLGRTFTTLLRDTSFIVIVAHSFSWIITVPSFFDPYKNFMINKYLG
jgi:hypothetical protein